MRCLGVAGFSGKMEIYVFFSGFGINLEGFRFGGVWVEF
jgi:hypothetical protein